MLIVRLNVKSKKKKKKKCQLNYEANSENYYECNIITPFLMGTKSSNPKEVYIPLGPVWIEWEERRSEGE